MNLARPIGLALLGLTVMGALAAEPRAVRLSAKQILAALSGKTLTDRAHWSYRYDPGGTLSVIELGKSSTGSWALKADQLCQSLRPREELECFEVWRSGAGLEFRRDGVRIYDGEVDDR